MQGVNLFLILPVFAGITTPTHVGDPNWASIRAVAYVANNGNEMVIDVSGLAGALANYNGGIRDKAR